MDLGSGQIQVHYVELTNKGTTVFLDSFQVANGFDTIKTTNNNQILN